MALPYAYRKLHVSFTFLGIPVKVSLSLCLSSTSRKCIVGVWVTLHVFLTSALGQCECQLRVPAALIPAPNESLGVGLAP
jgi:hypothetical protein